MDVETNWVVDMIERIGARRRSFFFDAFALLQVNSISGDYVEFGSWGGQSLASAHGAIARIAPERHCWAFDSFEGLPPSDDPRDDRWSTGGEGGGGVGRFHEDCAALGVPRSAYTAVEGYFDETLVALGDHGDPSDIALAYVDCNMYSSTVTTLEFLRPRLKHGMIIGFDDYWLGSADQVSGERSALDEFSIANPEWRFVRYQDLSYAATSFIVERAELVKGN